MARYIGKEMSRVDGVEKVTGKAKYAAEFRVPNLAYGFIVQSSIGKGTIRSIDTTEARRAPGVIHILTHENYPKPAPPASPELKPETNTYVRDKSFRALVSNQIVFNMQPIALVLAETFEQARYAARLVKATYNEEKPTTDLESSLDKAVAIDPRSAVVPRGVVKPRGNPAQAFQSAPVKIEAEYTIPIEHHNPMEPHGAIAFWENDRLTIFDKTQGAMSSAAIWRRASTYPKKTFRSFRRSSAERSALLSDLIITRRSPPWRRAS